MKAIDNLRTHMRLMREQGLTKVAMSTVNTYLNEIERELEKEYAHLPKDADGVTIHIGDRMENNERVVRIVLTDDSWEPSVYILKLPNVLHEYFCNEISHYHEPTVESTLQKLLEQAVGYSEAHTTVALDAIAEYAERLQLRGEDE